MIAKSRGQLHAVYIITEYAQGGDLLKLLLRKDTPLGWRFRIQIAKEVCDNPLESMHFHFNRMLYKICKSNVSSDVHFVASRLLETALCSR